MPRRAALGVLNALFTLQTTPEPSSSLSPLSHFTHHLSCDLALSHSSPSSPKSPLHEGTNGTLTPRRAALGVLSALFTLSAPPPLHSSPSSRVANRGNCLPALEVTCVCISGSWCHSEMPPSRAITTPPKSWGIPPPIGAHKRFRSIHQAKSQFLVGQSQLEDVQSLGNDKSSANDRQDSAISSKTLQAFSREPKSRYSHRNHHCLPFARESSYEFS